MENAGIKAFIFSFSLSLSTLIAVDKVLDCAQKKNENDLIITNKNIVLFISDTHTPQAKAQPTKKIALNILPDIEVKDMSAKLEQKPLETKPEETIITADAINDDDKTWAFNYIPLDIETPSPENKPAIETLQTSGKTDKNTPKALDQVTTPNTKTSVGVVNKITVVKKEDKNTEHLNLDRGTRAISESKPLKEIKPQHQVAPTLIAQVSGNEPTLLIPLERGTGAEFASQDMQIAKDDGAQQIAAADKSIPIKSIGNATPTTDIKTQPANDDNSWKSMAEIKSQKSISENNKQQSAWSVAKGRDFPKNSLILEADTNKSEEEIQKTLNDKQVSSASRSGEIQLAGEMIDNLLIPIPQEILEDENLTPQLTSSKENQTIEKSLEADKGIVRAEEETEDNDIEILDAQGRNIHKSREGLLSSLTSIFSGSDSNANQESDDDTSNSGIMSSLAKKFGSKKDDGKILPTEIRLSFQPNRAEISGTTLQWIQAFGNKAAKEAAIALEIRLNAGNDRILQQKRLNLLSNILTGRGVEREKIKVVYTTREPNSFVMRTIWINETENEVSMKNNTQNNNGYYLQW